jgi:hypothetical protein
MTNETLTVIFLLIFQTFLRLENIFLLILVFSLNNHMYQKMHLRHFNFL